MSADGWSLVVGLGDVMGDIRSGVGGIGGVGYALRKERLLVPVTLVLAHGLLVLSLSKFLFLILQPTLVLLNGLLGGFDLHLFLLERSHRLVVFGLSLLELGLQFVLLLHREKSR